jgi:FG-GAP repeat
MQIAVADLDGDGDLDLAMGGKTGLFLFENLSKMASPRRLNH